MKDYELAQEHVNEILTRRQRREERRSSRRAEMAPAIAFDATDAADAAAPRTLVAEGDSWFDYPGTDVLEELEEVFGYEIESAARRGDTLEAMAYGERQLDGLNRKLSRLAQRGKAPAAILLSAGGNDLAGEELAILLNHSRSGLGVLNEDIVRGLIDTRLRSAYVSLILTIRGLCEEHFNITDVPVVVHGYDYPVPDGRGFWGGWGPLPGPWLQPGFLDKGYQDLADNTAVMATLIDRFNDMLVVLAGDLPKVHHVDLRRTLSNDVTNNVYRRFWDNELHPEEPGFEIVASRFQQVLANL